MTTDPMTEYVKAQGAMIRELERLNTELNDELGTAVQVLKLERDGLRAEVEQWKRDSVCQCTGGSDYDGPEETCPRDGRTYAEWVQIASDVIGQNNAVRAALAEPTSNELPSSPKFEDGIDLTNEEFAAFLKAAKS